jgi:hypothetical protein
MTDVSEPYPEDENFLPDRAPEGYQKAQYSTWKRDSECARLKATGHTPAEIARAMGWGDDTTRVQPAIRRALAAHYKFTVDEIRLQELDSLDAVEAELWTALRADHFMMQNGRVVLLNGMPVADDRFALETLDRILKVKERRAKYLGLDATTRISVEADQIGSEITAMIAMINANADAQAAALTGPPSQTALPPGGSS